VLTLYNNLFQKYQITWERLHKLTKCCRFFQVGIVGKKEIRINLFIQDEETNVSDRRQRDRSSSEGKSKIGTDASSIQVKVNFEKEKSKKRKDVQSLDPSRQKLTIHHTSNFFFNF